MAVQVIETNKGNVEVSIYGKGTPVLFVHGGHSNCNEALFHKGFDQERFCLITPSRPGYGRTPLEESRTPGQCADLFVALLDKLNIEQALVVGISAGGFTAIEIAAGYHSRVQKLILISAVTEQWLTSNHPAYKKGKRVFSPGMERYSWALFRLLYAGFPRLMATVLFKELSSRRPVEMDNAEVKELRAMVRQQRSFNGFVNDLDQTIASGVLEQISCPTLVTHSLFDNTVGVHHATNAKTKIQQSVLKTYKNRWGHLLWLGVESEVPIRDAMEFITQAELTNP